MRLKDKVAIVTGGGSGFGEGIVNAALSARVGVAAMELCRPMPFAASPRPRVSALVTRALAGVFTHS